MLYADGWWCVYGVWQCKTRGERKISFAEFHDGLTMIAEHKQVSKHDLVNFLLQVRRRQSRAGLPDLPYPLPKPRVAVCGSNGFNTEPCDSSNEPRARPPGGFSISIQYVEPLLKRRPEFTRERCEGLVPKGHSGRNPTQPLPLLC